MKLGLIDLGSNTAKLAVYEVLGDSFQQIYYDATYVYLVGFIENRLLRPEGMEKIIQVISRYQKTARQLGVCSDILENALSCFSTASLRYIENQQEVINQVAEKTGLLIRPISGEQEAFYNFVSMKLISDRSDFLGGDLGGGSLQLFVCKKNQLAEQHSFPTGSLKLYHEFVSDLFPNCTEAEKMRNHLQKTICAEMKPDHFPSVFLMGGTVRLLVKLLGGTNPFSTAQLDLLIADFLQDPKFAKQQIETITPERLKSVMPGMLAVSTVAKLFSAKQIHFTENSVREGYLMENLLKKYRQ